MRRITGMIIFIAASFVIFDNIVVLSINKKYNLKQMYSDYEGGSWSNAVHSDMCTRYVDILIKSGELSPYDKYTKLNKFNECRKNMLVAEIQDMNS